MAIVSKAFGTHVVPILDTLHYNLQKVTDAHMCLTRSLVARKSVYVVTYPCISSLSKTEQRAVIDQFFGTKWNEESRATQKILAVNRQYIQQGIGALHMLNTTGALPPDFHIDFFPWDTDPSCREIFEADIRNQLMDISAETIYDTAPFPWIAEKIVDMGIEFTLNRYQKEIQGFLYRYDPPELFHSVQKIKQGNYSSAEKMVRTLNAHLNHNPLLNGKEIYRLHTEAKLMRQILIEQMNRSF